MIENILFIAAFVIWGFVSALAVDASCIELALIAALACLRPVFLRAWFERVERYGSQFASRRALCIGLAFVSPILIRVCLLPWHPIPQPWVPDEFSHLLIADTLSHGRFANPTHPLWQHFEAIHVFFQPAYASAYFPGLGLFMAAGKLLGHYWIGVLLSSALMCAALTWMLYGFFPERWALLGGVIAVVRWGALSYWVNSYWGGTVAAAAGALVLGGYARLRTKASVSSSIAVAVGLIFLAWSRPLEGFFFALPVAFALLWRCRQMRGFDMARVAVPCALIAAAGLFGLGLYCKTITGSAFVVPYRVNQSAYGWPLTLPWQHPQPVLYRHGNLRLYYEWERCAQYRKANLAEMLQFSTFTFTPLWRFYIGPALTIPLMGIWRRRGDRRIRMPLVCAIESLAVGVAIAAYPHYLAPATGAFLALIIQGFRHLRAERRPNGLAWSRIAMTTCLVMFAVRCFGDPGFPTSTPGARTFSAFGSEQGAWRANILRRFDSTPERHVVFVQYDRRAFLTTEWVYNEADIDNSKIIWANDMGPEKNREVLSYYPKRKFWLVRPDDAPGDLLPYSAALARAEESSMAAKQTCVSVGAKYLASKVFSPPKPLTSSSRVF